MLKNPRLQLDDKLLSTFCLTSYHLHSSYIISFYQSIALPTLKNY